MPARLGSRRPVQVSDSRPVVVCPARAETEAGRRQETTARAAAEGALILVLKMLTGSGVIEGRDQVLSCLPLQMISAIGRLRESRGRGSSLISSLIPPGYVSVRRHTLTGLSCTDGQSRMAADTG